MAQSIDDILAGKLATIGGPLSGFVSRRMANSIGEVRAVTSAAPSLILHVASQYFSQHGELLEQDTTYCTGVVGGGSLNLNPVHVTVTVEPSPGTATEFTVRAVAKEGIIKQRAGETTAPAIAQYISATV